MEHNEPEMSCEELRQLAADFPEEMDVIIEMLIDAEEDLCEES